MNINNNRLMQMPVINRSYSKWKEPHKHLTTIQEAGDLVPIFDYEVLPGDSIKVDFNAMLARMTTPIFPVMDDLYLDIFYFYVPFRVIYDKFPEFLGCKPDGYGIQENEYFLPSVYNITYTKNDIGSYITNVQNTKIVEPINSCYFRAYALIYNEWFRDENLQQPYESKKGYESFDYETGSGTLSEVSRLQYGIGIAKSNKLHDLFTSALPFTQRGPSVKFNFNETLPLKSIDNNIGEPINLNARDMESNDAKLYVKSYIGTIKPDQEMVFSPSSPNKEGESGLRISQLNGGTSVSTQSTLYLRGLGTDNNISFSINELRTAFAVQRYYEALSRSGNRYNEFIKGIFNVDIKDETIQRPIRLGSKRFNINMSQVIQTSSTNDVSPQGNVSGNSVTACDASHIFSYSFREAGIILGLVTIRSNNTYPNALPRHLSHLKKFDMYIPQLQAIGEQAILNKEIFYSGNKEKDNEVFGYQEAWYQYRYKPSKVTGNFADLSSQSAYASWTYATYFENTPVLNGEFRKETGDNVRRTLAVQDEAQFLIDYRIVLDVAKLMPLYSIPGLIDHF